ncbi:MAG: RNA methyltransferase [Fibrobacter sp.]|nr:RNA methyltransferase [Fibrobacter sp.]
MDAALEKRIKRQVIGKQHRFLAVSPLGFEQTLVKELELISAEPSAELPHVTGDGKVEFTAKITEAWRIVAYSRIANRVLMEIANFKAENFRELEKKASEIPFELYLATNHQPLTTIHVTCKHSRLYHSDAIAERLHKIIEGGSLPLAPSRRENGPSVLQTKDERKSAKAASRLDYATPSAGTPRNAPPQNLYVNFLDDRCTIWIDLAGEELYKRGHERFVNEAPLKETIAAAMLFEAFDATAQATNNVTPDPVPGPPYTLLDLMSGSGTFSLEAAYIANKLIPGVCRDFALKLQPAFKEATWNFITRSVSQSETKGPVKSCKAFATFEKILTSDISERAIEIIKHNVESSPLAKIAPNAVVPQLKDFFSYTAKEIADACGDSSPIMLLNPPYGKRLDFDAPRLYTKIGQKLTELANSLATFNKRLTVAVLAPKDDTRNEAKYTCTTNLLRECPALSPEHNPSAKIIETSHGGFSLNAIIAIV